jgi:anthranilate phosphoribosyltransferase
MVEKIYDPAGGPYHLIGLTHLPYLEKLGGALAGMGFRKSAIVQGMEGNEDLPTSRAVRVIEFVSEGEGGATKNEYRLNARDFGLTPAAAEDLAPGQGADRSAQLTLQVLRGEASAAWRDLVLFNAGFRVYLAGRAADVATGIELARSAIDSGAAHGLLERWRNAA